MPNPGLVFITKSTFSAASTVSIDNCFSATYVHYMLTRNLLGSAADVNLNVRLRKSGVDTASLYRRQSVNGDSTTITGLQTLTDTSYLTAFGWTETTATGFGELHLFNPFQPVFGTGWADASFAVTGAVQMNYRVISQDSTASGYDGITVIPASGTITGSISVFGWALS